MTDTIAPPRISEPTEPTVRRKLRTDLAVTVIVLSLVCGAGVIAALVARPVHAKRVTVATQTGVDVGATLSEWRVGLSRTTFDRGRYTFHIANVGSVQHELIAFKLPSAGSVVPLDAKNDVNEEASSLDKATDGDNIDPGKQQTRTIDLTSPGTYVFMCNLPGHYHLGMHIVVTVN